MVGTKCQTKKVCSCTAKTGCVLSVYVDDIKNGLSETHVGYILMKQVDQGEPTSVLDQVIPWCTQRKCKPKLKIVQENKDLISAGTVKELPGCERSLAGTVAWSHDMKGHAKKCVELHCDLARRSSNYAKAPHRGLDDHRFQGGQLEAVGELLKVCSQIVLECVYSGRTWQTIHFMVCELPGKSFHHME